MRVLIVGATGTVGSAVAQALVDRQHDVVRVGRTSGDYHQRRKRRCPVWQSRTR
ncbi:NAD-dependent epimerase/dehydratase family protein [Paraburkholderia phenazinium]|jgi:uncharacterized protein YbjT (DUF2867 family)|uniref:NAD-dependent epimerase/dehydratase family protein n=1 Tax=Paraburkholderia phenazinium TaxID=60549 RepID=UPI001FC88904